MKDQAIRIIQQYYDAFNEGLMDKFFSLLTEDVVHEINQGSQEVGKEVFRTFMKKMNRHYKEKAIELVIFANEIGTRAAAEFFIEGEYLMTDPDLPPAKGQRYRVRCGAFFELKGEKISRVTNYYNLKDWIFQVQ